MSTVLKEQFDRVAEQYDSQRKYLVPCMEDFYDIARELVRVEGDSPDILDLGAGTGMFTSYLYEKYNQGSYTLIDLSEDMLKIARERFNGLDNFEYVQGSYLECRYNQSFDAVISALSIHHLSDYDKELVYKRAYESLKVGGVFVNADQVLGATEEAEATNRRNWLKRIEGSPLTEEEKAAAYERMAMDRMATLEDNIQMLKRCGFRQVDVFYKYYNFAVVRGVR